MAARAPEEIRHSIEANRAELGMAVEKLAPGGRGRHRLALPARANKKNIMIGAAVAGFVIGGGIAGVGRLLRRRWRGGPANVNGGWVGSGVPPDGGGSFRPLERLRLIGNERRARRTGERPPQSTNGSPTERMSRAARTPSLPSRR